LILHQNGRDQRATRLDDAEAKRLADESAARADAIARRFKEQKPQNRKTAAFLKRCQQLPAGYGFITTEAGRELVRARVVHDNGRAVRIGSSQRQPLPGERAEIACERRGSKIRKISPI
jgi:hypothetical protein